MSKIIYREAEPNDIPIILQFILDLAEYEKLSHEVKATEQDLLEGLFCENPKAFCVLAEKDKKPVGFALCFYNYSTFQGKPGIYLEDLFVNPDYRGLGIGKGFFKYLAEKAVTEDCGRIQWWVLNWNEPSINFYKSLGAVAQDEWTVYRLEGQSIKNLAGERNDEKLCA
ncbi:MAG: GNAT family N-acetyltransferase [Micavibrio aeruginosavorus]|uniref:GNAT family N-acetyltransferase n=1 Tax=Micavibrio aeruginosavorus TaxID=349221 RepID=A0A2W5FPJ7_9BACT|nr:MAG: GNAT family N-acetyltransferase [Micavibrio aeruginosavorus]